MGEFELVGRVSPVISKAAFELQLDEVSQPIRSGMGVHLIHVTERFPGQLNQEDVRQEIIQHLSSQIWNQQVEQARKTARIELQGE